MNLAKSKTLIVKVIIFPEKDYFRAVCLDFNLTAMGINTAEAEKEIKDSIVGYIKTICDKDLDLKLLVRPAEKKYWEMLSEYKKLLTKRQTTRTEIRPQIQRSSMITMPIHQMACCTA